MSQSMWDRRTFIGALSTLAAPMALAQAWPSRPLKLVIPFAPGGSVDTYGRAVGKLLSERLGQPVVVENRAGAGGSVGSDFVAKSPPDGYTVVWGTVSSHAINQSLYTKIRYDNIKDFAPITLMMEQPLLVVVPANSKFTSMTELIAQLQAKARMSFGSPGVGSTGHMTGELMKRRLGADITHISYKGSNPMLTDLVGGHLDFGIDNFPSALAIVKGGRARALAVSSMARHPQAPELPTLNELLPGMSAVAWQGLFAPAGTPDAVLDRLQREVAAIIRQPDIVAMLAQTGSTAIGSGREEFANFVRTETARWAEVVKLSGAKADE